MPLENFGFNPQGTLFDVKAAPIPFNKLPPAEIKMCVEIAQRGIRLVQRQQKTRGEQPMPIDGVLYAMDIGAVRLSRPNFSLQSLLWACNADFVADFSVIIKLIDRNTGRLPDWQHLRCERVVS